MLSLYNEGGIAMFFQPILIGSVPYVACICRNNFMYQAHFHHELELMYCLEGHFNAEVNGQKFMVSAGQLLFVGGMQPHAYLGGSGNERLLIELGPLMMQEHFANLSTCRVPSPVIDCCEEDCAKCLFEETAALCREKCTDKSGAAALELVGNIYRIGAWLLRYSAAVPGTSLQRQIPRIESALALIHQHYNEPLTVEDAAILTGYGKSNFCKLFKQSVGMSFHAYLNAFRVRNAGYLLTSTSASVEEIGMRVGFSEPKTFCRVFREMTGTTPNKYRAQ